MRTLPRPQACGVNNVKDISVAKSGTEDVLKKDPAAEKAPDAGAVDADKAEAMFKKIARAHEVLSDADTRARYDRGEDVDDPNARQQQQRNPFGGGFHQQRGRQQHFYRGF